MYVLCCPNGDLSLIRHSISCNPYTEMIQFYIILLCSYFSYIDMEKKRHYAFFAIDIIECLANVSSNNKSSWSVNRHTFYVWQKVIPFPISPGFESLMVQNERHKVATNNAGKLILRGVHLMSDRNEQWDIDLQTMPAHAVTADKQAMVCVDTAIESLVTRCSFKMNIGKIGTG